MTFHSWWPMHSCRGHLSCFWVWHGLLGSTVPASQMAEVPPPQQPAPLNAAASLHLPGGTQWCSRRLLFTLAARPRHSDIEKSTDDESCLLLVTSSQPCATWESPMHSVCAQSIQKLEVCGTEQEGTATHFPSALITGLTLKPAGLREACCWEP